MSKYRRATFIIFTNSEFNTDWYVIIIPKLVLLVKTRQFSWKCTDFGQNVVLRSGFFFFLNLFSNTLTQLWDFVLFFEKTDARTRWKNITAGRARLRIVFKFSFITTAEQRNRRRESGVRAGRTEVALRITPIAIFSSEERIDDKVSRSVGLTPPPLCRARMLIIYIARTAVCHYSLHIL